MKHILPLTALLAAGIQLRPRLDGTAPDKKDDKPADKKDDLRLTPEEWAARERDRLSKLTADKVVDELVKVKAENFDLRRKAAPEGGTVLNADEAKDWARFTKLGKAEDVEKLVDQGKKDRLVVEKTEKAEALGKIASAAGWDAGTFTDLNEMTPGLEWRVQEVKKDGETIQQAQVKQGDAWQNADEFAEARWKKFLPVLQTEAADSKADPAPEASPRVPTGGVGGGKGRYTVEDAEARMSASGQYSM